jgi:hypothetical protein
MKRLAGLIAAAAWAGGCASGPDPHHRPVYPAHLERGPAIDIQVFVQPSSIRLTNASTTPFDRSTIWLNAWYGSHIDALHVGQTIDVPLARFRDEHGERIRGGGFFATEDQDPVVLAELETGTQDSRRLLRLVVVRSLPE